MVGLMKQNSKKNFCYIRVLRDQFLLVISEHIRKSCFIRDCKAVSISISIRFLTKFPGFQIFACAFVHLLIEANLCYIRQLFSIVCVSTIPGKINNYFLPNERKLIILDL